MLVKLFVAADIILVLSFVCVWLWYTIQMWMVGSVPSDNTTIGEN